MAKVDLKKSLGYSMVYDEGKILPQDISYGEIKEYSIQDMSYQLLNSELTYPEIVYSKYISLDNEGIFASKKLKINEYFIPSNLMGIEYVKTKAVLSAKFPKLFEVHYGGGTAIMQKVDNNDVVDVIITKIKRDQKFIVPSGYSLVLVNTRQQAPLIVGEIYNSSAKNFNTLDAVGGMSYYVIRKNAKQEIVRNPNYKIAPNFRRVKWDDIFKNLGITLKTPIAKQVLRKYDKFKWLFKEDSITI